MEGIRDSAGIAVLCSPDAMTSEHVRQELRLAMEFYKPLLPPILQPAEYPDEVKYVLAGRQWVEILDREETEWLPRVLDAIARLTRRPQRKI